MEPPQQDDTAADVQKLTCIIRNYVPNSSSERLHAEQMWSHPFVVPCIRAISLGHTRLLFPKRPTCDLSVRSRKKTRFTMCLGFLFSLVEPILVPFVFPYLFDVVDDGPLTCKSDARAASSPARAIVTP